MLELHLFWWRLEHFEFLLLTVRKRGHLFTKHVGVIKVDFACQKQLSLAVLKSENNGELIAVVHNASERKFFLFFI